MPDGDEDKRRIDRHGERIYNVERAVHSVEQTLHGPRGDNGLRHEVRQLTQAFYAFREEVREEIRTVKAARDEAEAVAATRKVIIGAFVLLATAVVALVSAVELLA